MRARAEGSACVWRASKKAAFRPYISICAQGLRPPAAVGAAHTDAGGCGFPASFLFGVMIVSMIQVSNLTFSYPGSYQEIFKDVSFVIDTDWKLGFTGRNGRG